MELTRSMLFPFSKCPLFSIPGVDTRREKTCSQTSRCFHYQPGKILYHMILSHGSESDSVVGSAVVSMLGRCGSPEDAHSVLNNLSNRTAVSFNGLITAYAQQGDGKKALNLYYQMLADSVKPTEVTFMYVLSACGILCSLHEGQSIHITITKCGLEFHEKLANALISMYGKCGCLREALEIFRRMPAQDVMSWNSVMAAYTQKGLYREAMDLFEEMQQKGFKPDEVSFTSILSACSRGGLIIEGLQLFFEMVKETYGVRPGMEHYGCVIDLLSRAGQLGKAEEFIDKMPVAPDSVARKSFLAACRFHGDEESGRRTPRSAVDANPDEAPMYVLLADVRAGGHT